MTRHYLDHASTSPLRPEARSAMIDAFDELGGDPSRSNVEGMAARVAVEHAREQVATMLGARPREVLFTSGATESIATAVWGARSRGDHSVVTAVEHSAVRDGAARGPITAVPVDRTGRVDPAAVLASVTAATGMVHVQWGNHEVGTTQPLREVVEGCREREVLVHVDAAQAAGHVAVDFGELGADLLSVSGHKLGGPPGVGALLVRRGLRLDPLLVGGDQERARRAGFENVPGIVGLGAAAAALDPGPLGIEEAAARRSTDRLNEALTGLEGVSAHGAGDHRLPHIACFGIDDIEPQAVLLGLDRAGVAAHSGSACSSEALEPSPVLEAMGVDARRSLRFSVGWNTVEADIDAAVDALPPILADLRSLRRSATRAGGSVGRALLLVSGSSDRSGARRRGPGPP
jgi:cysteine desulfurase